MKYLDAKHLHSGDEVKHKESGAIMYVVSVTTFEHHVEIMTNDGSVYSHTEIK